MALTAEFWDQLPTKGDGELYDILVHEANYLPEALLAARDELRKRSLPPERIAPLEAAAQAHAMAEVTKANEHLSWPLRILIYALCPIVPCAVLAAYYDAKGYKQKASDCWITLAISAAAYLLVGGCSALIRS